jgi:Tfp pilus assembly protein PilO
MDEVKKFVKENPAAVYIASGLLAVAVIYLIVFSPIIKKLGVKYTECRSCESQLWDVRNTIDYASDLDKTVGSRVLISEKEASAGMEELAKFGKSLGITFSQIRPGNINQNEGTAYKVLPIDINMHATGDQFIKFMGSVDELKKAIIRINSFNITPEKDNRSMLDIAMTVEIYLSSGS